MDLNFINFIFNRQIVEYPLKKNITFRFEVKNNVNSLSVSSASVI